MVEVAALSIAEVRNLERASREGWMRDEDSAKIASSTSSPKAWKFALFQFHFSSVFEGEFRHEIWQSTITRTDRWSEPRLSIVLHSTLSKMFLWTSVTSGALLPPVPGFVLVAEPSFATQKSFARSHSSRLVPSGSSDCHSSHMFECAFRSPPVNEFGSDGSSDMLNSLPMEAPRVGGSRRLI